MKKLLLFACLSLSVHLGCSQSWTLNDSIHYRLSSNIMVQLDSHRIFSLFSVDAYSFHVDSGRKSLPAFLTQIRWGFDSYGHQAAVLQDGSVLLTGTTCGRYYPDTDQLVPVDTLSVDRKYHHLVELTDGRVLVTGGIGQFTTYSSEVYRSCELFDPSNNSWSAAAPMPKARHGHQMMRLPNGEVLLVGGLDSIGNPLTETWRYDPLLNQWQSAGDLSFGASFFQMLSLPGGDILVLGGLGNGGALDRVERYNINTQTWQSAGYLLEKRFGLAAVMLPNGKVLISGGGGGVPFASCEIYDPVLQTSTLSSALNRPRSEHQMFRMAGNKIWAVGGKNLSMFHFTGIRMENTEVIQF